MSATVWYRLRGGTGLATCGRGGEGPGPVRCCFGGRETLAYADNESEGPRFCGAMGCGRYIGAPIGRWAFGL